MSASPPDPTDILVLEDRDNSLAALVSALRAEGHRDDLATDERGLLEAFLEAGGHAVLVVAPGVPEPVALRASSSLRAVDSGLRVVAMGNAQQSDGWPAYGVTRLSSHHPAAPQTIAALRRVLTVLQA